MNLIVGRAKENEAASTSELSRFGAEMLGSREKLTEVGALAPRHAQYVTVHRPDVPAPRELFAAILDRSQRFGVLPPRVPRG